MSQEFRLPTPKRDVEDRGTYFGGGLLRVPPREPSPEQRIREEHSVWRKEALARAVRFFKTEDTVKPARELDTYLVSRLKSFLGSTFITAQTEELLGLPPDLEDARDQLRRQGVDFLFRIVGPDEQFMDTVVRVDVFPPGNYKRTALFEVMKSGAYVGNVMDFTDDGGVQSVMQGRFNLYQVADALTASHPRQQSQVPQS